MKQRFGTSAKGRALLKPLEWLLLMAFVVYFSLFFLHIQQHTNLDHAKLVKYGEIMLEQGKVFNTNLFSYTAPDYPFVNHHWLVGLVFYGIHALSGFAGLTVFSLLMNVAAFLLLFLLLVRRSGFWLLLLVVFVSVPLISSRQQPRPELFSILFFVLNLLFLHKWYNGQLKNTLLWLLPAMQLLWVNLHILFYFGIFLQGSILLQLWLNSEKRSQWPFFAKVFLGSLFATLVNPAFLKGVVYPFMIMGEIEYPVSENMPFFFHYATSGGTTSFFYFEFALFAGLLLIYYWVKNPQLLRTHAYLPFWLLVFGALFLWRIRANVFYGYTLILLASWLMEGIPAAQMKKARNIAMISLAALLVIVFRLPHTPFDPYFGGAYKPGLGNDPAMDDGARYLLRNNIKGPIFNNFDIGDYLIYHLYPDDRVFVDGRPEAYPPGFFKNVLLPAIHTQKGWLDIDHQYRFNTVVLGFHTQVLGLVRRLHFDDDWFLAWSDDFTIIFLRMNDQNRPLIRNELLGRKALMEIEERFKQIRLQMPFLSLESELIYDDEEIIIPLDPFLE
jgi:hypothetical protein